MGSAFHILKFTEVLAALQAEGAGTLATAIDAVFFQSSNTQTFADEQTKAAFRERWLGRYLAHDPQWAYVALGPDDAVAGYLVGCLDDPALSARFADIGYFVPFAQLTARYPAHLHVNVAAGCRSGGLGSRLVQRFCADAATAGAPGVHAVTSLGARNVGFYERLGFRQAGTDGKGAKQVVFMAKDLMTS